MNVSAMLGLVVGGVIGLGFAWLQLQALRRNELLERQEELPPLLKQLPGTGGRIVFLLVALVIAQIIFQGANLVWMTVGVGIGYGVPFVLRLKDKYLRK